MINTIKIHFTSSKKAMEHSVDGSCYKGMTYKSGKVKTWIAPVLKQHPNESTSELVKRITSTK